jgi:N-methylhydantoinase B
VAPGDVFLVESGGGGGWGDARKRSAEARAADLANGFVTKSGAARNERARARRPLTRSRKKGR